MKLKKAILLISLLLCASAGSLIADDLPKGKIIKRVVCKENAKQGYSLYLPSSYTPEKKWPIIYGFDAGARGNIPVTLFKNAAEKYGIIVAGSLNSRNGPMKPITDACNAMWKDTHNRLSIDPNNVFFTGFSGGARVSCYFASQQDLNISGVIACSGGFHSTLQPNKDFKFIFFGTAGTTDFNLRELQHLDIQLDRIGMPNRVRIFKGGHTWAPIKLCTEGAEWMLIRSAKKGTYDKDSKVIISLFTDRKKKAKALESEDVFKAYLFYLEIADDFRDVQDITDMEERIKELAENEDVKSGIEKQEDERKEREEVRKKYIETVRYLLKNKNDLRKCKEIIEDMKSKAQQERDSKDKKIAMNVLRYISMMYREGMKLFQQKKYKEAIAFFEVSRLLYPTERNLLYNLACAYSLDGNKEKAVECLTLAAENGFTDINHIENDKDLEAIRDEEGYKNLIKKLKK
jgi:dienelactone hydrolase